MGMFDSYHIPGHIEKELHNLYDKKSHSFECQSKMGPCTLEYFYPGDRVSINNNNLVSATSIWVKNLNKSDTGAWQDLACYIVIRNGVFITITLTVEEAEGYFRIKDPVEYNV
jgi:hypothetical protein